MARNLTGAQYAALKYIELPVREETELMPFLMKQMSGNTFRPSATSRSNRSRQSSQAQYGTQQQACEDCI